MDWVLQHPGALIAECDPVLCEYQAEAVAENCYEQLSLLYVALTRAKRAAYVVIEPPGKSASLNYPRLLTATLGEDETEVAVGAGRFPGAWAAGEPEWLRASLVSGVEGRKAEGSASASGEAAARRDGGGDDVLANGATGEGPSVNESARVRLVARRPSGLTQGRLSAAQIFGESSVVAGAAAFGTAVHALLAQIEWLVEGKVADPEGGDGAAGGDGVCKHVGLQPEQVGGACSSVGQNLQYHACLQTEGILDRAVLREVAGCLQASGLRAVFARSGAGDEVWRERAFEAAVGGAWVSGIFDRVVLRREDGELHGAEIYDFKTDRGATDEWLRVRHAEQLGLYRVVVGLLTGLSAERIRCFVVATEAGRLVEITAFAR